MLDFHNFETSMQELKNLHDKNIKLMDILGNNGLELSDGVETCLLNVLETTMKDTEGWLEWWLYEKGSKIVPFDDTSGLDLTTLSAMYNFLILGGIDNGKVA